MAIIYRGTGKTGQSIITTDKTKVDTSKPFTSTDSSPSIKTSSPNFVGNSGQTIAQRTGTVLQKPDSKVTPLQTTGGSTLTIVNVDPKTGKETIVRQGTTTVRRTSGGGSGGINPATGLPSIAPPSEKAISDFYANQKVDTTQGASINERVLAQELARPGSTQTISQGFMQPGMVQGANVALAQSALQKPVSQRTYQEQVAIIQAAQGSQAYQAEAQRQAESQYRLKQQLVQTQPSESKLSFLNQQYQPKQPIYDTKKSTGTFTPYKETIKAESKPISVLTTPSKKDYSLGTFKGSQEQLSESQKIILSGLPESQKIASGSKFLESVTELFNPMKDFEKFNIGKGDILPGVIGLAKTPSYVVGTAGVIIGGGLELAAKGREFGLTSLADYYGIGKKDFKPIDLGIKTLRIPIVATKGLISLGKAIPGAVGVGLAVGGLEVATGFSKTRELGANVLGSTVKEALKNPIKFGTELAVFEGAGKVLRGITNIGSLSSKAGFVELKGRGAKYLINGKLANQLTFNKPTLTNVVKYDILKLPLPSVQKATKGYGFVEGALILEAPIGKYFKSKNPIKISQYVTVEQAKELEKFKNLSGQIVMTRRVEQFNLLKPSTYFDKLTGKKPGQFKSMYYATGRDLVLLDTPSEMIGRDISKLGGKVTTGITVSPGKGTPYARNFLKLSKSEFPVIEQPGTSILRQFSGAKSLERGMFFKPESQAGKFFQYVKGEYKPLLTTERKLNLEKIIANARSKVVSPLSKGITNKQELSVVKIVGGKSKTLALSGSSGEQVFSLKNLGAKDIDFLSTNAKRDARLLLEEAKKFGGKVSFGDAKHKGTINILIDGKARYQVSQVAKLPKTISSEGVKIVVPSESVAYKFDAILNPTQAFRHQKDLDRLQALVKNKVSETSLVGKQELPGGYVYYAGVGREPSLVEALSSGRVGWGKSPKMLIERQEIGKLSKEMLKPASKLEVSNIKKEFVSRFALAKQVESGLVAKPTEFLSTSDLKTLLKRGTYEQYAVYRRLTTKLNVPGTVQPGVGALSGLRTELETIKAVGGVSKKVQVGSGLRSGLSKVFDVGEVQIKYAPTKDVFGVVYQKNVQVGKKVAEKIINKTNKADWFKLALRDVKLPKVSSSVKPIYSVSKRLGKLGALAGVGLSSAVRGASVSSSSISSGVPKVSVGSSYSNIPALSSSVPSVSFKSSSIPSVSVSVSEGSKVSSTTSSSTPSVSTGSISKDISSAKPSVSSISSSISGISSRVSGSLSGSSISSSFKSFGSSFKSFKSSFVSGKSASISSVAPSFKSVLSVKRFPKSSFKKFSSKTPSFRKDKFSLSRGNFSLPEERKFGGVRKFSLSGGKEVNLLGRKEKYSYSKPSYEGRIKYNDAFRFNDSKSMFNRSNQVALIKNDFKINNVFEKSRNYSSGFKNLKSFFKGAVKEKNRYSYSNDYSVNMKGYSQKVKYRDTDLFNKKQIL